MNNPKRIRRLAVLWAVVIFCLGSLIGIEATSVQYQTLQENTDMPGHDYLKQLLGGHLS